MKKKTRFSLIVFYAVLAIAAAVYFLLTGVYWITFLLWFYPLILYFYNVLYKIQLLIRFQFSFKWVFDGILFSASLISSASCLAMHILDDPHTGLLSMYAKSLILFFLSLAAADGVWHDYKPYTDSFNNHYLLSSYAYDSVISLDQTMNEMQETAKYLCCCSDFSLDSSSRVYTSENISAARQSGVLSAYSETMLSLYLEHDGQLYDYLKDRYDRCSELRDEELSYQKKITGLYDSTAKKVMFRLASILVTLMPFILSLLDPFLHSFFEG